MPFTLDWAGSDSSSQEQGKREEVMIDEKFLKEVSIVPPSR
jgi:hypothetical protein